MILYKPIIADQFRELEAEVHYYDLKSSPCRIIIMRLKTLNLCLIQTAEAKVHTKFASLDDKIDGQHYYTMFIKFGQGRTMNDACRDIRDGYITRDEALHLMSKYDGEFPGKRFDDFCNYINISAEEYWEIIDNSRSPHL